MYYAGSIATGNSHITASVSALIWYGQSSVQLDYFRKRKVRKFFKVQFDTTHSVVSKNSLQLRSIQTVHALWLKQILFIWLVVYIICRFQELNVVCETKKSATLSTFILVAVISRRKIHNVLYKKQKKPSKFQMDTYLNCQASILVQYSLFS